MTQVRPSIVFVDDEPNVLSALSRSLRERSTHWDIAFFSNPLEAMEHISHTPADVVVSDLAMPELNGIEMLNKMRTKLPDATFMLLTGTGDFASAMDAVNSASVFRLFSKPCDNKELIRAIDDAIALSCKGSKTGDYLSTVTGRIAQDALETISPSVLVVNVNGKLVYANKSATQLLLERDGLSIDGSDYCRCASSDINQRLSGELQNMVANGENRPAFLSLPRPSLKRDLSLVLVPLDSAENEEPLIALVVTDPSKKALSVSTPLETLFGLSPSEATIAQYIARGEGLESAADASGVTLSTARTYLKKIYSKTGVTGQADLVQLILSSPVGLVKQAS